MTLILIWKDNHLLNSYILLLNFLFLKSGFGKKMSSTDWNFCKIIVSEFEEKKFTVWSFFKYDFFNCPKKSLCSYKLIKKIKFYLKPVSLQIILFSNSWLMYILFQTLFLLRNYFFLHYFLSNIVVLYISKSWTG